MPTKRTEFSSNAVNDIIYVFGGLNESGSVLNTTEAYLASNNIWITLTPMPIAKYWFCSSVFQDIIYIFGGQDDNFCFNTVEAYFPSNDTWKTVTSMPNDASTSTSSVVNDTIYVLGGTSYTILNSKKKLKKKDGFHKINRYN